MLKKAIAAHAEDHNTLVISYLFIPAWGRER